MTTPTLTTTADALAGARADRQLAEDAHALAASRRDTAWKRMWAGDPAASASYSSLSRDADEAQAALTEARITERVALSDHWGGVLADRVYSADVEHARMLDSLAAALSPIVANLAQFEADKRQAVQEARSAGIANGESVGRFSWTRGFQQPITIKTDRNEGAVTDYRSELFDLISEALDRSSLVIDKGPTGDPVILSA